MMNRKEFYTADQMKDAEKLCQLMQKVPAERRQIFAVSVLAYMNGMEAGMAYSREGKTTQTA